MAEYQKSNQLLPRPVAREYIGLSSLKRRDSSRISSVVASLICLPRILRYFMAQSDSGIGNVTPNAELVQMAMPYSRSYMLCAAARLGVADALGDAVRSVDHLATRSELFAPYCQTSAIIHEDASE